MRRDTSVFTRERIEAYPALTFAVLVLCAVYDRVAGKGLQNAIDGAVGGDFLSFYTGGAFVLQGRSLALSDPVAQLAFQRHVLAADVTATSVWVSPPFFAWVFAPFALLPYVVAYVVFVAASVVLLSAAFSALSGAFGGRASVGRMWWIAAQYYPALQWLLNGQTTGLWLSTFIGIFLALRRGRDARAGLLLGLFACKPTLALGLSVALLAAGRYRALAFAAVSSAVLVALGFVTLPAAMNQYLHRGPALLSLVRETGYHTVGLHGSFEFATLLLDGVSRRVAVGFGALCTASLLAVIASFWFRNSWRPASPEWDLRMAATLALGTVASPHLYGYDLLLLLLPLFIVAARLSSPSELPLDGGPVLRATAVVWALGLLGPVLSLAQQYATRTLFGFEAAVQFGVLAVVVLALRVKGVAATRVCVTPLPGS